MNLPTLKTRSRRRGFSLVLVLVVSAVLILLTGTMLLRNTNDRQQRIAVRGATDSFYAAEAAINTLGGRLSELGLGVNTITSAQLQVNGNSYITDSNLLQTAITADSSDGDLRIGAAYDGALPQDVGNGLGYLIYRVDIHACLPPQPQVGEECPTNQIDQNIQARNADGSFTLSNNIGRIDVWSVGFRGRGTAANLRASIFPRITNPLANNPYAGFGRDFVKVQNGDTYSAMPFCKYSAGKADCSQVSYIRGVYRNKSTGLVFYIDDSSNATLSSALSSKCTKESDCETVTGIYKKADGTAFFATANNQPPSGLSQWPVIDASTGKALPLPDPLASLTPALPSKAVSNASGSYVIDPDYNYLPKGDIGNLGSNGTNGGVSAGSGSTVNGAIDTACSPTPTSCVSISNPPTEGINGIPYFDMPPAPTAPTKNVTCAVDKSGNASCSGQGINGTSSPNSTITPAADQVIELSGSSSGSGVSISGKTTLTLYSGTYVLNDLDISGGASLKVVQVDDKPVTIYINNKANVEKIESETLSITGNGIANTSTAAGLQIYSNTTNTIKLAGNGALRAVVYSPNGRLELNGSGGGDTGMLIGSYLGKEVDFNGNNTRIIYDESLGWASIPIPDSLNVSIRNWQRL